MDFVGKEDLIERGWEPVDLGLWGREVDTVSEDFCKVMEDGVTMGSGDDGEVEGSLGGKEEMLVASAQAGFEDREEGVFESAAPSLELDEEFTGTDTSEAGGKGDTDSEDLGDGVWVGTSGRGRTEGILWIEGASAVIWELGALESVREDASGRTGLADFLCLDLGDG